MSDHGERLDGATVCVTGAHGMIGSGLVRRLLRCGARVVVLARGSRPASPLVLEDLEARCTVVHGDLVDPDALDRMLGGRRVEVVFHLAAQTIVGVANRSPVDTFDTNIRGTYLLLDACRRHDVGQIVVAGSDKAYGPAVTLPYREDDALRARYAYDVSKAAADLIARSAFHTHGMAVAVARVANVYGEGDGNRSRLIPETVAAVLDGRPPVIRSDGSPERDYLHVDDAVDAYLAIADALAADDPAAPRARGEAFNVGSGTPRSVRDLVDRVIALAGVDVAAEYRGHGVPPGEIDRQYVDAAKLRDLTGWAPRIGIDEGLRRTLDWYRAHPRALAGDAA